MPQAAVEPSRLAIELIGIVITVLLNAYFITRASGKTEGIIRTELAGQKERILKIEDEQERQWSEIGKHAADIGYLKGKANGKARHAGEM